MQAVHQVLNRVPIRLHRDRPGCTNVFEYHFENRGENIMTKEKLLEIGDRYEAQLAADKSADAPYR